MKRREQALLLLEKAAQDERLLDEVLGSQRVSDEIIGFHCQQAAEKLLKAMLSELGVAYRKTHDVGLLMYLLEQNGCRLPAELADLDALTPYGTIYRYDALESGVSLDRATVRGKLKDLRNWVEKQLRARTPNESG